MARIALRCDSFQAGAPGRASPREPVCPGPRARIRAFLRARPVPAAVAPPGSAVDRAGAARKRPARFAIDRAGDDRMSDFLASARGGGEDAFGAFVRRRTPAVHRWMVRAVGRDDADDMTQDVFLKRIGASTASAATHPRAPRWRRSLTTPSRTVSLADPLSTISPGTPTRFRIWIHLPCGSPEENAGSGDRSGSWQEALKGLAPEFRMPSFCATSRSGATRRSRSRWTFRSALSSRASRADAGSCERS